MASRFHRPRSWLARVTTWPSASAGRSASCTFRPRGSCVGGARSPPGHWKPCSRSPASRHPQTSGASRRCYAGRSTSFPASAGYSVCRTACATSSAREQCSQTSLRSASRGSTREVSRSRSARTSTSMSAAPSSTPRRRCPCRLPSHSAGRPFRLGQQIPRQTRGRQRNQRGPVEHGHSGDASRCRDQSSGRRTAHRKRHSPACAIAGAAHLSQGSQPRRGDRRMSSKL